MVKQISDDVKLYKEGDKVLVLKSSLQDLVINGNPVYKTYFINEGAVFGKC